jgi:hypothetical protein
MTLFRLRRQASPVRKVPQEAPRRQLRAPLRRSAVFVPKPRIQKRRGLDLRQEEESWPRGTSTPGGPCGVAGLSLPPASPLCVPAP